MKNKPASTPESEPFQISLRVRHPNLDPAVLTQALEIEAEHCFQAGTPRPSTTGAALSVYPESYWLGILKPLPRVIDVSFSNDQRSQLAQQRLDAMSNSLTWALSLRTARFLTPHADLLRRIRSEGGDVTLLVTIFNGTGSIGNGGTFTLAPETSQLFGSLGIAVEFDLGNE